MGNVMLNGTGDVTISNCHIENSGTNGIRLHSGTSPIIHSSTIANNDEAGISIYYHCYPNLINNQIMNNLNKGVDITADSVPTFGSSLAEWNDIYGNTGFEFYNGGTYDIAAEYIYWGTIIQSEIENEIYDENDSSSRGLVDFMYWTNAAHDTEYPSILTGEIDEDQCVLNWSTIGNAVEYWVYGAANLPWFQAGAAPGYENRVAIVVPPTTTWSSSNGVGDPSTNWTYLVIAVDEFGQELVQSNRVGEMDYDGDIP